MNGARKYTAPGIQGKNEFLSSAEKKRNCEGAGSLGEEAGSGSRLSWSQLPGLSFPSKRGHQVGSLRGRKEM